MAAGMGPVDGGSGSRVDRNGVELAYELYLADLRRTPACAP